MTKKYEHQLKTYETDYEITIYLITNRPKRTRIKRLTDPIQLFYVGQTGDEYQRLRNHNNNIKSGAYEILKNGGIMQTLGGVNEGYYFNDWNWISYEDTYESILISLVNYITADYKPYHSYVTNNTDYDKVDLLRYKLKILNLFPIHLNEQLIKYYDKHQHFDHKIHEELCRVIEKYHDLDEESIGHWATIMTLAKIEATDYEDCYLQHLEWLEVEENNRMYYYD